MDYQYPTEPGCYADGLWGRLRTDAHFVLNYGMPEEQELARQYQETADAEISGEDFCLMEELADKILDRWNESFPVDSGLFIGYIDGDIVLTEENF